MATKKPGSTSRSKQSAAPLVGVIMGSDSDFGTMKLAADALAEFDIPHEVRVVSAHRTPDDMAQYGRDAAARGLKIVIAGSTFVNKIKFFSNRTYEVQKTIKLKSNNTIAGCCCC